jgi:hypothetical protein
MPVVRRLLALGFALALGLAAAMPLEALGCGQATACPMMKMMAKAGLSCHAPATDRASRQASAGMSMPMSCCRREAASPTAPTWAGFAPALAPTPFATAADTTPVAETLPALPPADRHAEGLYTLHAVWRI